MATPKTKAAPKAKPAIKNTSAAQVPGNSADVSATEVVQATSIANSPDAGQTSSDEAQVFPPEGAAKTDKPLVAKALTVSAKTEGFRRAGRRWTVEAQTVDIDDFSQEQIEALLGEPMLDVLVVAE